MLTLQDFISQNSGQTIGDTPSNMGQCVGLVECWADNLGIPHEYGNAIDLLTNANPDYFDVVANSPDNVPTGGDIMVWGAQVGQFGHTAVFIAGDVNNFNSFDQNWPLGSNCHIQNHNYSGVIGWLHPRVAIPSESTPVEPPPTTGVNLTQDEQNALQVITDHFAASTDLQNQPFGNLEGYSNTLTQDAYRAWKDRPNLQLQLVLNQADLINAKAALAHLQNQINQPPVVITPSLPTNPATKSGGFFAWLRAFLG